MLRYLLLHEVFRTFVTSYRFRSLATPLPLGPITTHIKDLLILDDAFGIVGIRTKGRAYDVRSLQLKLSDHFYDNYEGLSFSESYVVSPSITVAISHTHLRIIVVECISF